MISTGLTQDQIKEANRVNILQLIRQKKETTKQVVAKELGLSIPTVTTNVKSLVEEGYVVEAGVAKSTGGRKPMVLKFQKEAKVSFGVNLTPSGYDVVMMNMDYEVMAIEEIDKKCKDQEAFETILEEVKTIINDMLQSNKIKKSRVIGVGLSLPGLVEEEQLSLLTAPNMNLKNYDFKAFAEDIGFEVSIENEANIAAFAESKIGVATDKNNFVYVSVTDGVGTGIIINNQIYKSTHKKAGEFGHMRVSREKRKCNCGRTGCWELYSSIKALKRYYGDESVSTSLIFEALENGNEKAIEAVETFTSELLIGVENIILSLNPEYVVLGGKLGKYSKEMEKVMENHQSFESDYIEYEGTKIVFSSLESKGALFGAGIIPFESVLSFNESVI
jgi:predicted NBD/HSP70 family sugar kinase